MGKTLIRIFTLGSMLIGTYLVFANGATTVKIIQALGGTANDSIRNLQGR